jgi:hypothetical protein
MSLKSNLDSFLGKRTTEKDLGDGTKQVCDLDSGDCYVVRMKDGLIERVDDMVKKNRKVQVETTTGVKQLLNG